MADDNTPEHKPAPRRAARKTAAKGEGAAKPSAAKRAPAAPKKPAAAKPAPKPAATAKPAPKAPSTGDRARASLSKATDKVGGKRNVGLIAGGLAVAGAAAAALLSLRSSTPKRADPAPDPAGGAHQPDGTDSSAQMDAMIADESMIPDAPQG